MSNLFVCVNDFAGCKVGTLDEIDEWLSSEGATAADSEFYQLGKQVKVGLALKGKQDV